VSIAPTPTLVVTREDLVLLIADGAEGPFPLDPVRLMKGCFIVAMAGRPEWKGMFQFRPYDYGPLDTRVYSARDALVAEGLLDAERTGRYDSYVLTDAGRERVKEVETIVDAEDANWLRRVGSYVTSKSFDRLLDEIYTRWPDYATESVHRR
jgi:hypothetical protein